MQWKTVEAFYDSWQEKESMCLSVLGDLSFWLMCCTMNACTHRMSCWAHAERSFTWLPSNKEERTNSSSFCSQIALRLHFDANSELGCCDAICEGSCPACQGQNWLGKTVCLKKNPFVVYWGTLQADHFTHLVPWKG